MLSRGRLNVFELLVGVGLLVAVGALVGPRLSQASSHDLNRAELRTRLRVLRCAIERFRQDHGFPPGRIGASGPADAELLVPQLTQPSDAEGRAADHAAGQFRFGPYLAGGWPGCPMIDGEPAAVATLAADAIDPPDAHDPARPDVGWLYDPINGVIRPNLPPSEFVD